MVQKLPEQVYLIVVVVVVVVVNPISYGSFGYEHDYDNDNESTEPVQLICEPSLSEPVTTGEY